MSAIILAPMRFGLLILPPQSDRTRALGRLIADAVPEAMVVTADTEADAKREIATADAAYGTLPPEILRKAQRLRWLQAPQAAPPAGYYHPELIAHPVMVTNLRGVFADRIPAHIMAYVLAFARGLQVYMQRQRERRWDRANAAPVVHLPGATALIVGVGSVGSETARLCAVFGMRVIGVDPRHAKAPDGVKRVASAGPARPPASACRFRHPDDAPHAEDGRIVQHGALSSDEAVGLLHQHRTRHDDEP